MESFYESVKRRAKTWAEAKPSQELETEEYFNEVYNSIKLSPPSLDKGNISINIGQEELTFENVPSGFSFYPGEKTDYVSFEIPINGDIKIFQERFRQMLINSNRTFQLVGGFLYIREYSNVPIEGNDKAIENIKETVRMKVKNIEDNLTSLSQEIEAFNDFTLKSEIRKYAKEELDKRNLKNETIDKLKLF